ncbi:uncharacterized protein [Onthophagus taurus]|uniref:uncharacterized protein n=1 Tax=Onthophagus taurus TaxID=166361 RepID=UPI000C20E625|nr:uncharacterized protein LOC111415242 isoform X1 [Onthophagus taurus]XP_022902588.1 uncharacterized protein LOC111415242 isoform X2 [Onthophagus taurus]
MEVIDFGNVYGDRHQHTPLCKFKRKFDLQSVCNDFKFVNIIIKPVPLIFGWKLEQYDVDVILNRLNFHLKIVCSTFNKELIRTLKIKIYNTNKQKELASCTNFLQRQKNLHLALNVLRKCSKLFEERKLIITALIEQNPVCISIDKTDDSGYCIKCIDHKRNFMFFESNWSLGWNYRNYDIFDFVDFMLNNKDKLFNTKVKPIMKNLTYPHNTFNAKMDLWRDILASVKVCLESNNIPDLTNQQFDQQGTASQPPTSCLPDKSILRKKYKKKLLENKDLYLIYPEIIEIIDSDEESSIDLTVESDNDVEYVETFPSGSNTKHGEVESTRGNQNHMCE